MWAIAAWGSSISHAPLTDEIRRHDSAIRYCYQRELPRLDPREGKFVVRFTLGRDGELLDLRVIRDTLGSEAVAECVLDQFRWMRYPPQRGVLVVTWPLLFSVAPQVARTVDHDVIRRWALALGGAPSRAPDGTLHVALPGDEGLAPIAWDTWFREFDQRHLAFLYEPGGRHHRVEPAR